MPQIVFKPNRAYPSVPTIGNDLNSHSRAIEAICEAMAIHERRTKEVLDSFVRVGELVDIGLIDVDGAIVTDDGSDTDASTSHNHNSLYIRMDGSSPPATGTVKFGASILVTGDANASGEITAAKYSGIVSSNLVDKSTAETISGGWTFSSLARLAGGAHVENGSVFRIQDSTNLDYIQFEHDGTDVNISAANTIDINITGITAIQAGATDADFDAVTATSYGGIIEANLVDKSTAETISGGWTFSSLARLAGGAHVENGSVFRIQDSTNLDYIQFEHDGTDVNISAANTIDINITGITAIQAGATDADFDAVTATSYGGIIEANLVDKSTAETISGGWTFNSGLYLQETAAAKTDTAGFGQIWVRNSTPNKLMFTDDSGVDYDLTTTDSGIKNVVEDLTPQLGGNLDLNTFGISVRDTRAVDDAPNDYAKEIQFDFKERRVYGFPGKDDYGGVMTFAPWSHFSGGPNYQLVFTNNNVDMPFLALRLGDHGALASDWSPWHRIPSMPVVQSWLEIDSYDSGNNFSSRGAGISVGKSGKKGSSAIHITYNGDGSGYVGMGSVDNNAITGGRPGFSHIDFTHNTHVIGLRSQVQVRGTSPYLRVYDAGGDDFLEINHTGSALKFLAAGTGTGGVDLVFSNTSENMRIRKQVATGETSYASLRDHGNNTRDIGFNDLHESRTNTTFTLAAQDAGNIAHYTNGTNYNVNLAASANLDFPVGACMEVINRAAGSISVRQGIGTTLYWTSGGAAFSTGNRTLSYGWCRIWRQSSTVYYVTGEGIG